jgi:membrane associated rhomboid family serine protease
LHRAEVWRYFTYSLVHLNDGHIITNVLLQLLVGGLMEMRHGMWRVALLYLLGVLTSSLAYYCFDDNILCGSSGGVYCLVASCICSSIFNWQEDQAVLINRFRRGKSPIACGGKLIRLLKLLLILTFTGLDFGWALYARCKGDVTADKGHVSVVAHCWGAFTGTLIGFTVLTNERKERWEQAVTICCQAIFVVFFSFAIVTNISGCRNFVDTLGLFNNGGAAPCSSH